VRALSCDSKHRLLLLCRASHAVRRIASSLTKRLCCAVLRCALLCKPLSSASPLAPAVLCCAVVCDKPSSEQPLLCCAVLHCTVQTTASPLAPAVLCCVQAVEEARVQHQAAADEVAKQIEELRGTAFSVSAPQRSFYCYSLVIAATHQQRRTVTCGWLLRRGCCRHVQHSTSVICCFAALQLAQQSLQFQACPLAWPPCLKQQSISRSGRTVQRAALHFLHSVEALGSWLFCLTSAQCSLTDMYVDTSSTPHQHCVGAVSDNCTP
jgi:hypothetical protein